MKVGTFFRRGWVAYAILALGLGVSALAYLYVRDSERAQARDRFNGGVRLLRSRLTQQLDRYVDTLLLTRGFIAGSEEVTREEWVTYIRSIDTANHYPGLLGMGVAVRVRAEDLAAHVEATRRDLVASGKPPDYRVLPADPPRALYFPTIYVEPPDTPVRRDQRALGYDLYSEAGRRDAIDTAIRTGRPAFTRRLNLVPDHSGAWQPGFLVFVPVYKHGEPIDTPEQRQQAALAVVYGSFHAAVLFDSMLRDLGRPTGVWFQIFDGDELLFDSRPHASQVAPDTLPAGELSRRENIVLGGEAEHGRTWTLAVTPADTLLSPVEERLPTLVLSGGFLTSWLLFGLLYIQIRSRLHTEAAAAEIQKTQTALRASELRYRLKIEQSPMAIQTLAPDGHTVYVNGAWEKLWGLKLSDLSGYNMLEDPELERRGVSGLIRKGFAGETVNIGPIYYEPRVGRERRGRPRWVRSVMYPVKDENGNLRELVLMHEDFTERKMIELELMRAKEEAERANSAKDHFLAILSHELRNPLSPVLAMSDVLASGKATPDEMREALDVIRRNIELEARLIDDLLDMTRIARGKLSLEMQRVDAHTALAHALEICHRDVRDKRIALTVQLEARSHEMMGDPMRLRQIFWNLIKNAVKFTPEQGGITVRSWDEYVGPDRAESRLAIEVSDTGIGIEPQVLARIFEAFEQADRSITRRFGGLGLGLAISRALVEGHRGQITAASGGHNKGATFTVRFPVAPAATQAPAEQAPQFDGAAMSTSLPPLRILLVEDHVDARRALTMLLRRSGYEVRAAESASGALEIAAGWEFDLMISDLGLPDFSGLDLVRRMRSIRPVPAIALTGLGMEEDVRAALEAGFGAHLTKPVQFEKLEQTIAKIAARS